MAQAPRRPRTSSATDAPTLRPFQAEDVAFIKDHDFRVLVANAPGTGKSPTALGCINIARTKLTPTLIVCPASVVTNWCREAKKWVKGAVIHAIADMSTPMPKRKVDVFVTSWSLLPMRYLEILALKPKFIIADEVHLAKNEDALRTQALSIIAKRTPHMILLSGTPLVNRPAELETIKGIFGQEAEVPMIRRLLEDVLPEIPPKTRSKVVVTMRPKDESEYRKAEKDFAEWLEAELHRRMEAGEARATAERALAAEALVKTGYLRRLLGMAKVPAAVDWVSRAVRVGEPVIVFCEHQEVVSRLQHLLTKQKIRHVTIDGSTPRKQRQVAIDAFQAGLVPVFIGTKAAKEGITLTRARNLLFVERYFTSADEEQAEDRCIAEGQLVQTETGLRPIESVRVGDKVLTHAGAWRRVDATRNFTVKARGFHRPAKRPLITEITYSRFHEPLVCTYDHKILVLRYDAWRAGNLEPEWVDAASVLPQDFLCLPVPSETHDVETLVVPPEARHDSTTTNQFGVRSANGRFKPLPDVLVVDEETLFFFGWYLAEGFVSTTPGKGRFVSLSGHERERPILERIAACLARWNVNATIYAHKRTKGIELRAFSTELAKLMGFLFGNGSENKTVPLWVLSLPVQRLEVVWDAYTTGDGYRRGNTQEWRSVSDDLGPKMALVAARLGRRPTLRKTQQQGVAPIWTGAVTLLEGGGNPSHHVQSSQFVFNPVLSVNTYGDKDKRVYDLSVEGDESFVVGHAAVHNCRRFGQKYATTIWFLHGDNTIDDRLAEIIDTKRKLVSEHLGSSHIMESEESAVVELISAWHDNAAKPLQPSSEATDLGLGKPLPPMPSPQDCYQLHFKPPRWTKAAAKSWAAMHGFRMPDFMVLDGVLRATVHGLDQFVSGKFYKVTVTADIVAIMGTRRPVAGAKKRPSASAKKPGKKTAKKPTPKTGAKKPTKKKRAKTSAPLRRPARRDV